MADAPEPAPAPKKKGKFKLILLGVAAIAVLGGGGVAAGMYVGGGAKKPAEDPNRPKLVLKDGKTAPAGADHGGTMAPGEAALYKASYLPLDQTFTSNMRDSDSIMQVGLGVSTLYDDRVLDAVKRDDMPIRSAVLMTLAEQNADSVATPDGKKTLRKALKDAINQVLVQKEGFGGIDDVYFTSLIIQ